MNKYQKIILIAGALALFIVFGKTLTKVGFGVMALMGKGIIVVAATLLIFFALTKPRKKN
ncbi:MAG: hypothetical protein AB1610_10620 [Nitrospirota bacterium]